MVVNSFAFHFKSNKVFLSLDRKILKFPLAVNARKLEIEKRLKRAYRLSKY